MPRWFFIRQVLTFFGGMAGFFYETVFATSDRVWLLIFFGGMVGLPFVEGIEDYVKKTIDKPDSKEKK